MDDKRSCPVKGIYSFRLKVNGKKWRQDMTWMKLVEEETIVGLSKEDALCRSKWIIGANQIAAGLT